MKKPKLLVIAGPTASGKSALAMELAGRIPQAQILCADSLQVYRYFDIGTAKPTAEERSRVPHHLIDIINPDEDFNAGRYSALARRTVDALGSQGAKIIVSGGTYLYVRALISGIIAGIPSDAAVREALRSEKSTYGGDYLYRRLVSIDPDAASRIHPNDYVRIERALEVHIITGNRISQLQASHGFGDRDFESLKIGIFHERERRREIIDRRVEWMMQSGFLAEVEGLRARGFATELKPMQSIGYRQLNRYIDGEITLEGAVEGIKVETKRFAKRQTTWLRAEGDIKWRRAPEDLPLIFDEARAFFDG
ncbi:MAG: tRNA (adenosine(37)-N6)-dimethylallyltransferase MiaA [Deltaproteobacteria bacterium]